MKTPRKIILSGLIGLFALSGQQELLAQNVGFEQIFKQSHQTIRHGSRQGAAIFDKYLFQCHNGNRTIAIYDMESQQLIEEVLTHAESPTYHCNNAGFGKNRFSKSDFFPLLYISMENIKEHKVLVFRIEKEPHFKISCVQTITFPAPAEIGVYYPNMVLNNDKGELIQMGYKQNSYKSYTADNRIEIVRYKLPELAEGNVTLKADDMLDRFDIPCVTATQGAFCKKGRIYQVYGAPGGDWGIHFQCINLKKKEVEILDDLEARGFPTEPEGFSLYKGDMICCGVDGTVFSISLSKTRRK